MDLKTKMELVELGLKIVVAVAAGAWAIALYWLLRTRAQADAKLRETEANIRLIELNSKRQTVIRTTIEPTVIASPDGKGFVIIAVINIANVGSQSTTIEWSTTEHPFTVRRVEKFDDDSGGAKPEQKGKTFAVPLTANPMSVAPSHIIRAGGIETISFAVRVTVSGLYLLTFRGRVSEQARKEVKELGDKNTTIWGASKYLLVNDAATQAARPAIAPPALASG
jgi:hypothetical protein